MKNEPRSFSVHLILRYAQDKLLGMTSANALVLGDARWRLARPICVTYGKLFSTPWPFSSWTVSPSQPWLSSLSRHSAALRERKSSSCSWDRDRTDLTKGGKMELKQFTQEHFATLASWFPTEADLIQWGGPKLRFPLDDLQMNAMLENRSGNLPDNRSWMALHDGSLLGHAQLVFDWKNGNATLARVAIAPAFRGRKLAVPMLDLAMAEAFNYPQLMRLELNVFSFNQSAIRAYRRLGFATEGKRRSSVAVGDERWDTVIMAVLRSEYQLSRGREA